MTLSEHKTLLAEAPRLVSAAMLHGWVQRGAPGKTYEELRREKKSAHQRAVRARLYAAGLNSHGQPRKTGGRPSCNPQPASA